MGADGRDYLGADSDLDRSTGFAMRISLTPIEMTTAANVGVLRRVSSLKNGIQDQMHSRNQNPWQIDIEGACAEAACAKALGVFWNSSVNTFKTPDLAGRIQVRSTANKSNRLIIRDHDKDEDVFVLMIGAAPSYELVGWVTGREGKDPKFIRDANDIGKPAYFVPQDRLHSITKLKAGA